MAKNITMDYLKEQGAIKVYSGMIAVYPQFNHEEALNISELAPKFNGCYAVNNSTVCFVSNNEVFVTPYTRNTMRVLDSEGFVEKNFFVPFSNWDYPKKEQGKWESLREESRKSHEEDFVEDCVS